MEDSEEEGADLVPVFPLDDEEDSEALNYLRRVREQAEQLSVPCALQRQKSPIWESSFPSVSPLSLSLSPDRIQAILSHFSALRSDIDSLPSASLVDYQAGSKPQWWAYFNDPQNQPWADYAVRFSHGLVVTLIKAMARWMTEEQLPCEYEVWLFALLALAKVPLLADTEAHLTCIGKKLSGNVDREGHLLILVLIIHFFRLRILVETG